jgi:hypothetical protein
LRGVFEPAVECEAVKWKYEFSSSGAGIAVRIETANTRDIHLIVVVRTDVVVEGMVLDGMETSIAGRRFCLIVDRRVWCDLQED